MNIAGWLDQCTDSFSRMQQHLTVPTRSIVGPWTHGIGLPGPAINIQYESLRWWDRWLKGIDTGVTDEPPVAMYVNHSYKPGLDLKEIPGEWRYEDAWPVSRIKEISFYSTAFFLADNIRLRNKTDTGQASSTPLHSPGISLRSSPGSYE